MIQIENLHFSYSKKKALFTELDLQLRPGKIYGLLGKNGTGKSTLLKLIIGGLFPDAGRVQVDQFEARKRTPAMLEDIYFLPEEHDHPAISIEDYVAAYAPFYPRFDASRFQELLSLFEVDNNAHFSNLSFGQKKKALISFGIATGGKYLLLDEPTNGLDIPSKSQFRKALLSGFREDQIIIISTHQVRDLDQLIESVIIVEQGKIIFNQDVFDLEEKLLFTRHLNEENLPDLIYNESTTGGCIHIQPNRTGKPSQVELEVLFNAVIKNRSLINQYL